MAYYAPRWTGSRTAGSSTDYIIKPLGGVSIDSIITGNMSVKSSDGARELPNLVDTQFKAHHIFTILVGFLLLVDLKQLFWVVNFRIHLLFSRQEILSGFIAKILIMGRSIWLILPTFILITLVCTFLVDKVRGSRTFSRLDNIISQIYTVYHKLTR